MTSTLPRIPGSPNEEMLLAHLQRHVSEEQDILASYDAVAKTAPEHVRYLIDLIADDEDRHHRLLREMVNRIDADITYSDAGPAVPYVRFEDTDRDQLIADTKRFMDIEKDDLKGLRELEKLLTKQHFGGLFPLLVELMELDTKKHIAILEFISATTRQSKAR